METTIRRGLFALLVLSLLLAPSEAYGKRKISQKRSKRPKQHFLLALFPELKPPPPKGSSLALQNRIADEHNLPRIQNSKELAALKESGYLVRANARLNCFAVNQKLAKKEFKVPIEGSRAKKKVVEDLRYLHPDALKFIEEQLAERYCRSTAKGSRTFVVSSLVRTQEYQRYLASRNPNAREAIGDTDENRSAHITGYGFDISTLGHKKAELTGLAKILLKEKKSGYLAEAIFEPHLNNFHIMVFPCKSGPR